MRITSYLLVAFFIILPSTVFSQNIILGVDFDLIDWSKVCPNIEPVKLTLNSGGVCEIAHPLDEQIYLGQFDSGIYTALDNKVCDRARKVFETYTKPRNGKWEHCRLRFSGTYRVLQSTLDKVSLNEVVLFRDTYLKSGVVDVRELFRSRERIIEHNQKKNIENNTKNR